MKPKLVLILLLIVVLPLGALSWLGLRVAREEREVVQNRFREALLGRLRDIDSLVSKTVEKRERDLLPFSELKSFEASAMRDLTRKNPAIRELFVLDANGMRLHPPPNGPLTTSEQEFLERAGQIWRDKQVFYRSTEETSGPTHGWYTWYWGSGVNLLFWMRTTSGHVIGVECDRIRMIADIVGELPNSSPSDSNLANSRIALLDSGGTILYQWGAYEPASNEQPSAALDLSPPLHSLALAYFASDAELNAALGGSIFFNLAAGMAVLWIALTAMAVYFYRESTREMREASERVSFVNQVSHELKTPLTNIRMYAELLETSLPAEDTKSSRSLGIIVSESQRLSRLIGNVLTFASQQRNKLALHPMGGVVDDCIRFVLDHFRASFESKRVKVAFSAGAGASVEFDRDALEQILGNLFSNVEKYAAAGGLIEVTSRQNGERTSITVADRGPGVPKGQEHRIFEPFHRLSNKLSDGVTGTGIGLSIARDLARKHGGDLKVVASDSGACFQVELRTPAVPVIKGAQQ